MSAQKPICQPTEQLENGARYDVSYVRWYQCVCERVFVADLFLLSERHQCQWLHGLILQNSSKLLILHVLWDLQIPTGAYENKQFISISTDCKYKPISI